MRLAVCNRRSPDAGRLIRIRANICNSDVFPTRNFVYICRQNCPSHLKFHADETSIAFSLAPDLHGRRRPAGDLPQPRENVQSVLEANRADIAAARENGMLESMIDRLTLTAERIEGMAKGVDDVAAMPDPVGRVLSGSTRPNGLRIEKVTVPLGVIGIIYEARPNVTSDAAALCLKAGNAVILRGGKEAINSNKAVANLMRAAVEKA